MRNWRKPVVEELARLLAMVSRFNCCALMPLAAVYKARIITALLQGWTGGEITTFTTLVMLFGSVTVGLVASSMLADDKKAGKNKKARKKPKNSWPGIVF